MAEGVSVNSSLISESPWVGWEWSLTSARGVKCRDVGPGNFWKRRSRHAALTFPPPSPPPAEKVSSLGKDWHKFCLKCERCNKTLTPGGHAEHDGKPFCHKPCYATLFGPKGKVSRVPASDLGQLLRVLGLCLLFPSLCPSYPEIHEAPLGEALCETGGVGAPNH